MMPVDPEKGQRPNDQERPRELGIGGVIHNLILICLIGCSIALMAGIGVCSLMIVTS